MFANGSQCVFQGLGGDFAFRPSIENSFHEVCPIFVALQKLALWIPSDHNGVISLSVKRWRSVVATW